MVLLAVREHKDSGLHHSTTLLYCTADLTESTHGKRVLKKRVRISRDTLPGLVLRWSLKQQSTENTSDTQSDVPAAALGTRWRWPLYPRCALNWRLGEPRSGFGEITLVSAGNRTPELRPIRKIRMHCVLFPMRTVATICKNGAVGIVEAIKIIIVSLSPPPITCVCSALIFSIVFCVVRAVHKFDLRLEINKWRPLEVADSASCVWAVF